MICFCHISGLILVSIHDYGNVSQWAETAWNRRIQFIDINRFPMSSGASEWASERTNERSGARERSEQCGASEWVSGASERASGRANGPVLTSRFPAVPNHRDLFPDSLHEYCGAISSVKGGKDKSIFLLNVLFKPAFAILLVPCNRFWATKNHAFPRALEWAVQINERTSVNPNSWLF